MPPFATIHSALFCVQEKKVAASIKAALSTRPFVVALINVISGGRRKG